MSLKKSTIIEMIASTPDKDVVGESLDIAGADISPILEGRGYLNSDHRNDFAHTVGRILTAKKILKAEDCETPTQLKYWSEVQKPFLWAKGEIWDGVGHKEADSIASVYKFYNDKNEAPPVKVSVEGKVLERSGSALKRTLIKNIAITLAPCNRNTKTEVIQMVKSQGGDESLVKNEDYVVPCFREISIDPLQKIYSLAVTARQLLRSASEGLSKAESKEPVLKSQGLLERLKQMIADSKKSE